MREQKGTEDVDLVKSPLFICPLISRKVSSLAFNYLLCTFTVQRLFSLASLFGFGYQVRYDEISPLDCSKEQLIPGWGWGWGCILLELLNRCKFSDERNVILD